MAKAKRKKREKARRLHREPVVRAIAEILATGEPTRWRWSSSCHRGIRAALCLKGWKWDQADQHAASVVRLAAVRIGLQIPSSQMAQGDPPQEVEHWFCKGCGGFMRSNSRPWCSEECRHVLRSQRYRAPGRPDEMARLHAVRIILTGGAEPPQRRCKHCDQLIAQTMHVNVYCSSRCRELAREKAPPRQCAICEETFQPLNKWGLYCSDRCYDEGRRRNQRVRKGRPPEPAASCCTICNATFVGRARNQLTCSDACRAEAARRRARAHHEAKNLPLADAA